MRLINGATVLTVKLLVALVFVLFARSVQLMDQLCWPSVMPGTEKLVAVLFLVVALVRFKMLSRYKEQFIVGLSASVAVKLKLIVEVFVR